MNSGGQPDRGRAVFDSAAAGCAACHKVHDRGGDVGPDPSQVGGNFDHTHLIESIFGPSAEIAQENHCTVIETRSGRVVSGVLLRIRPTAAGHVPTDRP